MQKLGKAGASRWCGIRPTVRGVAMNPVDHPLGGGAAPSSPHVDSTRRARYTMRLEILAPLLGSLHGKRESFMGESSRNSKRTALVRWCRPEPAPSRRVVRAPDSNNVKGY